MLLDALDEPEFVWFAAVPLGRLKEARAVSRLIEYLRKEGDDEVSAILVGGALLEIGTPEAVDFLRMHPKLIPRDMRRRLRARLDPLKRDGR